MTKDTTKPSREPVQPTYYAYAVSEPRKHWQKARWTRIGVFFAHEDGQGGNLVLDAMPINFDGRLVLRTPLVDDAEADGTVSA